MLYLPYYFILTVLSRSPILYRHIQLIPILRNLQATGSKDSWKDRQEGVIQLTSLLSCKQPILNTPAVGETISILKDRLSETNINLRTKVVQCLGEMATALGGEVQKYLLVVVPELLKYSGDSKAATVTAV